MDYKHQAMASPCRVTRLPTGLPTWSRLERASARHEQTTCTRIVDFLGCLADPEIGNSSWRKRHRRVERTAQHDITDERITGQPDGHLQAVGQLLTAHEFHRLNRGWLSGERGPQRARRRAVQIGLHVFRGESRDLAWVKLERRSRRSWRSVLRLSARHHFLRFLGAACMNDA